MLRGAIGRVPLIVSHEEERERERAFTKHMLTLARTILPSLIKCLDEDTTQKKNRQTEIRIAVLKQLEICLDGIRYGQEKSHVALLSWAARNILELWIWALYIRQSDVNIERFYQDVMLDVIETVTALSLPIHDKADGTIQKHERFVAEMQKHKVAIAPGTKPQSLRTGLVAKSVGLDRIYRRYYPMFSKAAHQTALLVLKGPYKHPMGLGMPEGFAGVAIWQSIKAVVSGYSAAESLLPPLDESFFRFPPL